MENCDKFKMIKSLRICSGWQLFIASILERCKMFLLKNFLSSAKPWSFKVKKCRVVQTYYREIWGWQCLHIMWNSPSSSRGISWWYGMWSACLIIMLNIVDCTNFFLCCKHNSLKCSFFICFFEIISRYL